MDVIRGSSAGWEGVLCRTENFAHYHEGQNSLLRGSGFLEVLQQLSGEEWSLFKEKINHKLARSCGITPRIDTTACTYVKNIKDLTILFVADATNMKNGSLEVVEGSHLMTVPISKLDICNEQSWMEEQK